MVTSPTCRPPVDLSMTPLSHQDRELGLAQAFSSDVFTVETPFADRPTLNVAKTTPCAPKIATIAGNASNVASFDAHRPENRHKRQRRIQRGDLQRPAHPEIPTIAHGPPNVATYDTQRPENRHKRQRRA
jgi:hypothetical protein